jgi:hypothetical protein
MGVVVLPQGPFLLSKFFDIEFHGYFSLHFQYLFNYFEFLSEIEK